jgi:hypothetical protein
LIGAAHGVAASALLFATSRKYTFSNDWFLAVMIVFANTTGFAVAGRYGLNLIGVAIAGVAGMLVGGWLGTRLIGNYEYKVPTPPEQREMRFVSKQGERVVPLPWVPAETTRRIPVGGGVGVLLGWIAGAGLYALLFRQRDEEPEPEDEEPDA